MPGEKLASAIKLAGKSAFYVGSRMLGYFILGVILNLILFYFILPELQSIWPTASSSSTVTRTWSQTFNLYMRNIGATLQVGLICFIFFLFPFLWLWIGKIQGVSRAVALVGNQSSEFLVNYLMNRFYEHSIKQMEKEQIGVAENFSSRFKDMFAGYCKKLNNLPRSLRWVFRVLIEQTHLDIIIDEVVNNIDNDKEVSLRTVIGPASEKFKKRLEEEVFAVDLIFPIILLVLNLVVFSALKFYY